MPTILADRCAQLKPSATMALNTKAKELASSGVDMINLTAGEPDFDTPEQIKQAGIQATKDGHTKYSPVNGIAPLLEAICNKLERDNLLNYDPTQIIVSNGAKHSLYNIAQAVLNPGDEAIIPVPYWVSYPSMVAMTGAESVFIDTSWQAQFKITAEQLQQAITPKTKLLFLNSPSNPSGMVYNELELAALADVLLQHPNITIITDDIYEYLIWGKNKFTHLLQVCPKLKDQTVIVNGCSKAYAMTGWRIGYTAAPENLTQCMKKIQSHSTSGPNTMAQYAAVTALQMSRTDLAPMLEEYDKRLTAAHQALDAIPTIDCLPAAGAFYLFPAVGKAMAALGIDSDLELAGQLLEQAHVATVPGTAFGCNGYLRLSCACDIETLTKGIERIANWLQEMIK